jgi:hypothetical protein
VIDVRDDAEIARKLSGLGNALCERSHLRSIVSTRPPQAVRGSTKTKTSTYPLGAGLSSRLRKELTRFRRFNYSRGSVAGAV